MGTLKDEMRGVSEDRLLCEKAEDGEHPGSSDGTSVTGGQQSEESTTQEDQPKMDYNKDSKDNANSLKASNSVDLERQSISVAVPSTPDPMDPRSPAPFGQQHMRTQVSLEVVQCRSAATSPMTPQEGGHNFFFPSSFERTEAVGSDTKDAELQVGQQVECCSVATSPMTPKTPFFSSFPLLPSSGSQQRKNEEFQGCHVATKNPAEPESEISEALKLSLSKEQRREDLSGSGSPASPTNCPAASVMNSESKQQRMGSMDQDITILVTQHGNNEEDDEKSHCAFAVEPEMVKLLEQQEEDDQSQDGKDTVDQENSKSTIKADEASGPTQAKSEFKSAHSLEAQESRDLPESPAPFGCHNMRTQVSLEVVQCHSAATSPMTPPEGDQAFCFPSTLTKCGEVGTETKDAEMQVGQQVEYRSVATAPMTPRTPTATIFPEIQKGASIEEKIVEEEEDTTKQDDDEGDEGDEDDEDDEEEQEETGDEEEQFQGQQEEESNCKEDTSEEPVQEVSWDEKGMTWEVYGAVVEVSVLGSAIQKHLEKQVKKQKTSLPPPPPLNPSATPLTSEASPRVTGSGKGRGSKRGEGKASRRRRNPFRLMMENMQQPHCCSRAHTTE